MVDSNTFSETNITRRGRIVGYLCTRMISCHSQIQHSDILDIAHITILEDIHKQTPQDWIARYLTIPKTKSSRNPNKQQRIIAECLLAQLHFATVVAKISVLSA